MFSKSKSKEKKKKTEDKGDMKTKLAQFGLLEVPDISNFDQDNDSDLEEELLQLTRGGNKQPKKVKKMVDPVHLDRIVADCLKDEDDDITVSDEEDPELLAELNALGPGGSDADDDESSPTYNSSVTGSGSESASLSSPIRPAPSIPAPNKPTNFNTCPSPMAAGNSVSALLLERRAMYEEAKGNATASGDTSRARRFHRGLNTLNLMLKEVNAGKAINEEDIPPVVITTSTREYTRKEELKLEPNPEPTLDPPRTIPQNVTFTATARPNDSPVVSAPYQPYPTLSSPTNQPFSQPMPSIWQGPLPSIPPHQPSPSIPVETTETTAHPTNLHSLSSQSLIEVTKLQNEYKTAALDAKKTGDKESAIQCLRVSKQLQPLIEALQNGQPIDSQSLPSSPAVFLQGIKNASSAVQNENNVNAAQEPQLKRESLATSPDEVPADQAPPVPANQAPPVPANQAPSGPPVPTTVLEALEQRLLKYTEQRDKAKAEDNSRKERMNQRIMKQYQDAIKSHKAGKAVSFEDLPTPPGFAPIPTGGGAVTGPTPLSQPPPTATASTEQPSNVPSVPSRVPKAQAPSVPENVRMAPKSRVERQLSLLEKRQNLFKEAALDAKKKGEIEQAKEYLRNYKGLDHLILATNSGLPVDMNTVPIPPQEKLLPSENSKGIDFEIVNEEDCIIGPPSTPADIALIYTKLEEDFISQIKMCARTREHYKALGDVASANRFEQLILHSKKDLDSVRVAFKRGDTPPKFHYESRSFTMMQCNTDLNDSDCEVTIIRGINYNVSNPKDVDTCVKIEFPYPSETPPQERSEVVKDSNSPEYNHKVVFSIDRKTRAVSRVFKRHSIKCQVICKGGWFHRDTVFGSIKVPLMPLENKITLHESYDLTDEKKKMVGGKLEVKVRLRNPILSKHMEKVTEKWLVIDHF